jgi:hypothetical protein
MKYEITVIDHQANEETHVVETGGPLMALETIHTLYQVKKGLLSTQYRVLSMHKVYRSLDGEWVRQLYLIPSSKNPDKEDLTLSGR